MIVAFWNFDYLHCVEIETENQPQIYVKISFFFLQSIPQFLPVMRGTLSLPANRDPEVLERLQPVHLTNICNRMQSHLNVCSSKIATDQAIITAKIKEVREDWDFLFYLFGFANIFWFDYRSMVKRLKYSHWWWKNRNIIHLVPNNFPKFDKYRINCHDVIHCWIRTLRVWKC